MADMIVKALFKQSVNINYKLFRRKTLLKSRPPKEIARWGYNCLLSPKNVWLKPVVFIVYKNKERERLFLIIPSSFLSNKFNVFSC